MANARQVAGELDAFANKLLRASALDVQGQMKKMTPVDTGRLRSEVQLTIEGDEALISNQMPYAKRVYLEGHSPQLPAGEFQAFVATIPQRMEGIAKRLM